MYISYVVIATFISLYPICWFLSASLLISKLALDPKQAYLIYFHIFIVFSLVFTLCNLFVTIVITPGVIMCTSHKCDGYQNLVIMWSLVALLAICVFFKPAHHKYATANARLMTSSVFHRDNLLMIDKDRSSTSFYFCDDQNLIRDNHDTEVKEMEAQLKSTIV